MRVALVFAGLLVPSVAFAHISMTSPPPRTAMQKMRDCGDGSTTRGTNVTTLAPGSTITVTWNETIDHPGHYRISFDMDGQDFSIPPTGNESTEGMPNVVKDLIPDVQGPLPAGGRVYSQEITLPDMECSNCTLQLIQVMTDGGTYNPDGSDVYYQCADFVLTNGTPAQPDAGPSGGGAPDAGGNPSNPSDTSGGCATTGGGGLALGLGVLGLVGWRRRRAR